MSRENKFIGLTVALSVIGVGLLVAAFATDHWVESTPVQGDNSTATRNRTDQTVYSGKSNFGIFKGEQSLKYATGPRSGGLTVVCEPADGLCLYVFMRPGVVAREKLTEIITAYKGHNGTSSAGYTQIQYGLFSFALWVSTIVFLSLSIILGLVTIGFSFFNIFGRPIETITGPRGLYLWNTLFLVNVGVTVGLFSALYITQLSENFMMLDDYRIHWRSEGHTHLAFSFFLLLAALAPPLLSLVLLCLASQALGCSYPGSAEKEVDNGMILY